MSVCVDIKFIAEIIVRISKREIWNICFPFFLSVSREIVCSSIVKADYIALRSAFGSSISVYN